MKLITKIIIIIMLAVLALAAFFVFQLLVTEDPDLKPDTVSARPESTVTNIKESSSAVDIVKSESSIDDVSSETTIETVTPATLMNRIKYNKEIGKIRKTPATLQIIENGQTLSEVIHRIGDPQGLLEIKDTDTLFLYYMGDLKVNLIKGKVVNLTSDFNEKLKQAVFGKEQKIAVQSGRWNKIKRRGRQMKGKTDSILRKFRNTPRKSKAKSQS